LYFLSIEFQRAKALNKGQDKQILQLKVETHMNLKSVVIDTDPTSNSYRNGLAIEMGDSIYINLSSWRQAPYQNVKTIKKTLSNLRGRDKSIVIFSFGAKNNLIVGLITALIANVKFVPTVNGLGRYVLAGSRQGIFLKLYLWVLASVSSSIITQNSRDFKLINHKKKYLAHGSGIPTGFLLENWKKRTGRKLSFGYVGRVEKTKGIYHFFEIAEIFPNIDFYVYSKLSRDVEFELQRKKPKNVVLAGFLEPKQIFKKIDAIIFPSTYGEGVARVILEALSSNTFVISTSIPGNLDLVNEFGMKMTLVPLTSSLKDYQLAVKNLLELKTSELSSILLSNKKNSAKLSVQEISKIYKLVRQNLDDHG